MARKNAKTTLAACIAIAVMYVDGEKGCQIYAAATKEDQAKIVINDAAQIIKATPELAPEFILRQTQETYSRVIYESTASFMKPLGRDSKTQDGFDPAVGIIDEYHAHPTSYMLDVIESGQGARDEPLLVIITTAGFNKSHPCYEFRNNVIEVLKENRDDEAMFGIVYTLDDGDDWQDESVWIKSNPNLGVSVNLKYLQGQKVDAINLSSKRSAFLTKNMNVWVDSVDTWIPEELWTACEQSISIDDLSGADCYLGLDLASRKDATALSMYFPQGYNGQDVLLNMFFSPKDTAKKREEVDKVPYLQWAKDGWMILTDGGAGKTTDYEYIRKYILDLSGKVNIKSLAYDKWNSSYLINKFEDEGMDCFEYGQTFSMLSFPTKEFEKKVVSGELAHNGNPCMSWMLRNVQLMTDTNDNVKINKKTSPEKVDGPASAMMALGKCFIDTNMGESNYLYVWKKESNA